MAEPLPIAGWYPDPEYSAQDRWWNGTSWSENRRDSGSVAAGPVAPHGTGLYIPGEVVLPAAPAPAPAYAPYALAPIVRNNLALIGFILSMSGFVVPLVLNSLAGGIVSAIGLRRSKTLAGNGAYATGRGLSIAGILTGFIWGLICLLFVVGWIVFVVWILATTNNIAYPSASTI